MKGKGGEKRKGGGGDQGEWYGQSNEESNAIKVNDSNEPDS